MLRLRDLVLQLHETLRPFDCDLAPGESIIDSYFARMISLVRSTGGIVLVADAGARNIVGYAAVFGKLVSEDPDERQGDFSFIADLFVLPDYRGSGLGRKLVARAEEHARMCGAYKIELKVLAGNDGARRFYQALGYAPRVMTLRKSLDPKVW